MFPGTSLEVRNPCKFVRPQERFETHSELTGLTSGGTLSPPRYGVMTLRTGCDYDLGSGFPPDETIPDDRRVQLRGIFVVVRDVSV